MKENLPLIRMLKKSFKRLKFCQTTNVRLLMLQTLLSLASFLVMSDSFLVKNPKSFLHFEQCSNWINEVEKSSFYSESI